MKNNRDISRDISVVSASFILIVALSLFIIATPRVHAVSLSVTKAVMNYDNVLRGGYAEDTVYVSTDADINIPLDYEVIGDLKGWIFFEPDLNASNTTIFINRTTVQPIKIIVKPPVDARPGNYSGGVRIITGTINKPGGQYGSQLQAAFLIRIQIAVTGTEHLACDFSGITIADAEIGQPLEYSMTVSNSGNVRITPNVSIDIWNQDQTKFLGTQALTFNNQEVLPTTQQAFSARFDNPLRIGQYWAYVTLSPCQKSDLVSFNVVEKGTIADKGELLRVENKPWAAIGEAVPITAVFRNNGARTVSAKIKGTITLDGKIVQVIDTDFYDVDPGETKNIDYYFTPKKFGQYYISARVLYNNKLSFEKSSILNVNSGQEAQGFNAIYIIIILAIIIIVLFLLIKIRKRKQHIRRW